MVTVSKLPSSLIEEAQSLVRRCAEPRPAGDLVKAAILRVSRRLGLPFNRAKDIWYGDARRIDAEEMDLLRAAAVVAEVDHAALGIEVLRTRLAGSPSPVSREVVAGIDAALRALGRD
jgi:hypothetical protein